MVSQLEVIEPIPPPDVRRPVKLSFLPPWVAERLAGLRIESQADQTGRHRMTPVLPRSLIPVGHQKMLIERHIEALGGVLGMTPEANPRHAEATMIAVSKMLLVLPSKESGDLGGEAKGEAFMDALEDLPFWSVQEAMRKWHRSEYGPKHDYRWQPAPSTLRECARIETFRVTATQRRLCELRDAEVLIEFSEEHRTTMRAKFAALVADLLGSNRATGARLPPANVDEENAA